MINIPRWQHILTAVICLLGVAFAVPNLFSEAALSRVPGWLPNRSIQLGLDLQGGSHLLLEVDVQAVVRERLESLLDEVRAALRAKRIGYQNLGVTPQGVTFTVRDAGEAASVREALRDILGSGAMGQGPDVVLKSEGDLSTLTLSEAAIALRKRAAVEQSLEIVRRRIDETGTREPTVQIQGDDRILVQLPGVDDPERIKRLLGKTAKLNFRLVDPTVPVVEALAGRVPPGSELLESDERGGGLPQHYVVRKRVYVSGDQLVDAQPSFQQAQVVVSFRFDSVGARRFGDTTKDNVNQLLAIVLDGRVISAPRIREPILGGSGIISGSFTVQSATDLALLLRAGALPAPLKIIEERSVGPSLGADSIAAGQVASLIGLILVVGFIVVYYGLFGVTSVVALLVNLVLLIGALTALGATLTLPGVAGIVLTMGMAVDANVLIFERMREEVRLGKTPLAAIDAGYRRAFATILDSNLTTLFAGIFLFQFGSGPVRGFAVTLSLGIVTSMFTAIMISRILIVWWLRRYRPQVLPI
ncbi:MAG: protein translocase subunit SecD [Alphaproteobacteria bacterium]|nr:protein translocase subunit SecD [Alphaproteobacteria bacterium]